MKSFLILTALCLQSLFMNGQNTTDLKADSAAIIETALNYGDGWYSGDPVRMEKAIHPDLNKICPVVMPQTGKTFLMISSWSGLVEPARAKAGFVEEAKRKITVTVFKINDNVACARLASAQFNDYLEMVKFDGQWKIVNVLWTFGPDSPNRAPMPDFKGNDEKPAVEQAVHDFIEGIYTSDVPRIEKVLHPEYRRATPITLPSTGKTFIQRDAAGSIMEAVRAKTGAQPKEKWNIQVNVLDIMDGLAFAELIIPSGYSYAQLAKIDGQWKIINILRKMAVPPAKK
ncbi:MAG: nuclear transport factor 2 family protein [Bacteroidia bacterium]|nr:nuclear transport factor 2 family protein [Bacteroidia bacterium]